MISQSSHFAEVFCHSRDSEAPNRSALIAKAIATTHTPPDKAHLRRLARHAAGRQFREPLPKNREISPSTALIRQQLEFHKKVLAQLGGSRTIVPEPATYDSVHKRFIEYVPHVNNVEHEYQPTEAEKEAKRVRYAEAVARQTARRALAAELEDYFAFAFYQCALSDALDQ